MIETNLRSWWWYLWTPIFVGRGVLKIEEAATSDETMNVWQEFL